MTTWRFKDERRRAVDIWLTRHHLIYVHNRWNSTGHTLIDRACRDDASTHYITAMPTAPFHTPDKSSSYKTSETWSSATRYTSPDTEVRSMKPEWNLFHWTVANVLNDIKLPRNNRMIRLPWRKTIAWRFYESKMTLTYTQDAWLSPYWLSTTR